MQEAVALRLGQRVDALGLDRVLGGQHEERVGQRVGDPADGDLPLGHDLEQRRLHLGRRAVDLVGEHEVGEHRAELDVEGVLAGLVDAGADDVGGHQVGGELQAGERAADGRSPASRPRGSSRRRARPRAARGRGPAGATSIRSTSRSWPTMTRLISNSTRSSWAASTDGGTGEPDSRRSRSGCWQRWSRGSLVVPVHGPGQGPSTGRQSAPEPVSYTFLSRRRTLRRSATATRLAESQRRAADTLPARRTGC